MRRREKNEKSSVLKTDFECCSRWNMNRTEMKWKKNGRRLRFWILKRERIIHTCNYNDDMNSTNLLLSFDMMLFASSSFYYRRWCCIRIIAAIAFLPPLTHVSYHFFCVGFESRAYLYRYEAGENWKFYMHIEQSAFHEYYHVFFLSRWLFREFMIWLLCYWKCAVFKRHWTANIEKYCE